jgi:ketosteroid isomerase-like protein
MNAVKLLTTVGLAVVFLSGCRPGGQIDVEAETARLLQTDRAFARASLERGAAEAFRMYLDENATMFSSGRHPVRGRNFIYEVMKPGDGAYVLRWTPREGEVAQSGEMGWTWGEYTVTTKKADGGESTSYGKYVNVWKKDGDGDWKVIADIGNDSPPPEKAMNDEGE